tara:strand:+ start:7259 stop:7747 length:489 start_codon:yes stop_codon:yes gene_type:complete
MNNQLLTELAKEDARWRSVALKLCGDKDLADDLVQDMYLKAANLEFVKAGWVYRVLGTLFIDHVRQSKLERLDNLHYLECKEKPFEPNDYEQQVLDKFNKLYWTDQDLIRESYDRSLREIQESYPMIQYGYAQRRIVKCIKEILGDDFETQYFNNNNKHKNK